MLWPPGMRKNASYLTAWWESLGGAGRPSLICKSSEWSYPHMIWAGDSGQVGNMLSAHYCTCVWMWVYTVYVIPFIRASQPVYIRPVYFHPSLWIIPELQQRSPVRSMRWRVASPLRSRCHGALFYGWAGWAVEARLPLWEADQPVCLPACLPLSCCSAKTPKSILQQLERHKEKAHRWIALNPTQREFIQYERHQDDTGRLCGWIGWKK